MGKHPNILWIITDQQRAESLSINGCENASTPVLDGLAKTGANFTSAISGFPLCCPYRGSMLTSRYPHKCVPGHEYQLPPEQPTVAAAFNEQGYDTFYLGKWHLDGAKEAEERAGTHYVPRERRGGFRSWLGYENNNAQYDCYLHGHRGEEEIEMFRLPRYETDAITDIMIEYLQKKANGETPFFAVMSVQPPHDPYVAPPENQRRHTPAEIKFRPNVPPVESIRKDAARELAGYYAMIENIDQNVGRIVDCLNQTGLMEHTHIIYFSDHGDMHGSHGQFRKTTPYQEAVNVPFIISGEKRGAHVVGRKAGNVDRVPVNHVDIAPTSLGLCGLPIPDWMEGTDYSGMRILKRRKSSYPTSAYLQSVIPTHHDDSINKPWRGIVTTDGYKYICLEGMDWLLFDLNTDPYELVNLAHNDKYLSLRHRLKRELRSWIEKTGDSFLLPEE
ncbi:Arylsulfatase [uncultured Ruminococcus sp.]|uniref:Sulfatase n=1 Tax=Massiliimalia timonensis TaxID=1987501 RepID=A0A8J6TUQ0_9FIRM|nr:sulfatase [Massiliimalia timonensis]MBC8610753.1 sulfatase [Massiliimalia timonensis]SCH95453.1 Arylsulfatase [uncultured Clostridium sp.]SCI28396.1 Arylsulfatase [uncultured Ruminococcus sp.]